MYVWVSILYTHAYVCVHNVMYTYTHTHINTQIVSRKSKSLEQHWSIKKISRSHLHSYTKQRQISFKLLLMSATWSKTRHQSLKWSFLSYLASVQTLWKSQPWVSIMELINQPKKTVSKIQFLVALLLSLPKQLNCKCQCFLITHSMEISQSISQQEQLPAETPHLKVFFF